jgi:hypothetical protein
MANTFKKFKVKRIRDGVIYFPFNGGGQFFDMSGNEYIMSDVQARTIKILGSLPTAGKQFAFFCYAYCWQVIKGTLAYKTHPKAFAQFKALREEFSEPWNWNAKRTLPVLEPYVDEKVVADDGLDLMLLRQKFDEYGKYQYILYPYT